MYYLVVKRHLLKRSLPVPVHLSFKKAPYYIYKKKKHNSYQLEKLIPLWSSPGKQAVGEAVRAATGAVGLTRYIKAESGALDQRLVLSHLLVGNRVVSRGNWRAITSFAFLFLGGYVQIWLWVSRSTSWKDYCDLVYINNSLKIKPEGTSLVSSMYSGKRKTYLRSSSYNSLKMGFHWVLSIIVVEKKYHLLLFSPIPVYLYQ